MKTSILTLAVLATISHHAIAAITLDLSSQDSIKQAAAKAAAGMVQHYTGNRPGDTPGNLPAPYYWWEAGAMFGSLIDYWYFTGDDQYNAITMQAMLHQASPGADFQPANQTKSLGNDDQAFWAMAALSAAENKFPDPPADKPQWLALAQAVFNLQASRWNTDTCGGGLKWQIFAFNNGYQYKNTISNGCFLNIGSRLAVYTGNKTYADWVDKTWDWSSTVGLFDARYNFWDGSDDRLNCSEFDRLQWSYNAGTFLVGAANMYNFTDGAAIWEERIRGIIGNLGIFLKNGIMWEAACEEIGTCNIDQRSFKAYFARWMAMTMVRAPFTQDLLRPILETSAMAAVRTCTGGDDGNQCGLRWWQDSFDGSTGVGEQMAVLEVIQSNLIGYVEGPATIDTGTSVGDSNAGTQSPVGPGDLHKNPMTTADRAGAAIFTVLVVATIVGAAVWLVM